MSQVEILPQSIVDTKTIVLKPRLDQGDIQLIGDKIKSRLFTKFVFKPNPDNIRVLSCELYFEPYLIIGGRYSLDYCKEHVFEVRVSEKTTKVFVAGQEFEAEQSGKDGKSRIIRITGEEYAHYQREAYFALDRMGREIPSERLPLSPFEIQEEKLNQNSRFRRMEISDERQIEFLKAKIARRPDSVAEIIKEVFDITERTVANYPMFQLTFQNAKNKKSATIAVNGVTGEITLDGTKKLVVEPMEISSRSIDYKPIETPAHQEQPTQKPLKGLPSELTDKTKTVPSEEGTNLAQSEPVEENIKLGFPAKIFGEIFTVGDNITAVVGDIDIPSDTIINETLVVKGTLKIGDKCQVNGKLKALKDITVGADTIIYGDVVSGGNVLVGPRSLIAGRLEATGCIRIGEQAKVERGLHSTAKTGIHSDVQMEVGDIEEHIASSR